MSYNVCSCLFFVENVILSNLSDEMLISLNEILVHLYIKKLIYHDLLD